jgi:Domain of unknown function (DUF5666)
MSRNKPFLFVVLLAFALLSSCSGAPGGGCIENCSTGSGTLSVTLLATPLTPPAGTNLLSFATTVNEVSFTPSTGTALNISPSPAFIIDLTQLQSDSLFLGKLTSVPAGTYTVSVSLGAPILYYCKQPNGGTPGCVAGTVAKFTGSAQTPVITSTFTVTSNQSAGIALNFNLQNALTVNASQVVTGVDFTAANALTFKTLPNASTSLAAGQLDFVEDITGVVTAATSPNITIKTAAHGSLTVATNSSTVFPSSSCSTATFACVVVGQVASIDAALNSDGTLTALEYDPLPLVSTTTGSDIIEGVVTAPATSSSQFQIVANNLTLANSGSLLSGSLSSILGSPVTVNLSNAGTFLVDSRGLDTPTAAVSVFTASNDASILLPGQTVAIHATSFVAASGNTPASVGADALMLRYSRVTASISAVNGSQLILQNLPLFYGVSSPQLVQLTSGSAPTSPSTNYDGATPGSVPVGTVSIRALYLGSNAAWAFTAAKVRVP